MQQLLTTAHQVPALVNPHTHLREDAGTTKVVGSLIKRAIEGGATVLGPMPNTEKGLTTAEAVTTYIAHAEGLVPHGKTMRFVPIVQITEQTTRGDVNWCVEAGIMDAKIYPLGRTTKSHNGVRHFGRLIDIVRHADKKGMRIHLHPEHPSLIFENRDAEFAFVPICEIFLEETDATIVWEHGTDGRCIPHWIEWAKTGRFYVTITGHHLVTSESETYGDVQAVCKPPYKTEGDRKDLVGLVGEDHKWVMAGGDDAPHPREKKHVLGPCTCGAYTAPFLLPLYAHGLSHLLETPQSIATFVNFTSRNARKLYKLPVEACPLVTLKRRPFIIPPLYQIGSWEVEPFWAGRELAYSLAAA